MTKVNCKDCSQADCAYFGMDNKTTCKDFVQQQPADEPVALQMDVIVVNLVRAGIDKHHARELAEHFIKHTRPQPATQFAGSYGTIDESAAKRIATALGWEPKREWVALTQQDIDIAFDDTQEGGGFNEFARAIEAKLREKNGGKE